LFSKMKVLIVLLVVSIFGTKLIYSDNPKVAALKNFKAITNAELYDKDASPNLGENTSLSVGVTMHVIDYEFNPITRLMSAVVYFRQRWTDPRLGSTINETVIGGKSLVDRIWIPDTFFSNSLEVVSMSEPMDNTFLMVQSDGEILFSQRVKITFRCPPAPVLAPNVTKTDECTLDIESYGFSIKDMDYMWGKPSNVSYSIGYARNMDMNNKYKLAQITGIKKVEVLSTGNYSRILAKFEFRCRDCVDKHMADNQKPTKIVTGI